MVKKFKDMFNRLDTIPACDRQTDGRTGILPRYSPRYAYTSRGKNWQTFIPNQLKNYLFIGYPFHKLLNSTQRFSQASFIWSAVLEKIPCGGLSWLPVSFLLHVKYTLSYRIVSYRMINLVVTVFSLQLFTFEGYSC